MKTAILTLAFLSAAAPALASGRGTPQCDAIRKSIADQQALVPKALACVNEADATILRMQAVAADSWDRTLMDDPQVKAAFKLVTDRRDLCLAGGERALAEIKRLEAEYVEFCDPVAKYGSLSNSAIVVKAARKQLGKCMIQETSDAACPMKVLVNGREYPTVDGCQKTVTDAAKVVREALKGGRCF